MPAEKNFENKVKEYLESQEAWFIKYWGGAKYTKTGIPDILCCINGYFLAIEIKGPNGKPSDLQIVNIREIRKAGGIAIVLWPDQYARFKILCELLKSGSHYAAVMLQTDCFDEKISVKQKEILYKK